MKKLLFLGLLSILFLSSCAQENNILNKSSDKHSLLSLNIKNWDDTVGTYTGDVIPNEECAIAVATEIYRHLEYSEDHYVPINVFYDEVDKIWIVTFFEENNVTTVGEDCSIAIQQSDGRVLRIWFGE